MKNIILMCTIIVAMTSCKDFSQKKTDLEELNLNGSIQSILTLSFKAVDKFGEGNIIKGELNSFDNELIYFDSVGNTTSKTTYYVKDITSYWGNLYDKSGYKIRSLYYDDNGKLKDYSSRYINDSIGNPLIEIDDDGDKDYYTYDKKGMLIKKGTNSYYDDYEYDKNGNLLVERMHVGGYGDPMIYKYTYDSNNNRIVRDHGDSYWEYKYNEMNQNYESLMFEKDGSIKIKRKNLYNTKGDVSKEMSWNSEGLLTEENNYYYLHEDTLLVTLLTIDKEKLFNNLICNSYNSNNKITSQYGYKIESELFYSYNYHYNNNLLTNINYNSEYTNWTESFVYDKKNNLIESNRITEKNRAITNYDKNKRIVQITEFDKNNAIVRDIKMKYHGNNDNGFVERTEKNNTDNTEIKEKNIYEKKLLVQTIAYENNIESTYKYKYNDNNDIVEMVSSKENEVMTFQYKYDSKGNWITKTIFNNKNPTEIQERLIVYY